MGGTAWELAAFIARLDGDDKPGITDWLKQRRLLSAGKHARKQEAVRKPVATYSYTDAAGRPIARKLRFEPGRDGRKKDFTWQRWDDGAWADGLGSSHRG